MGVNSQRPNMLIRPPCYASHEHAAGMWNLKIQVDPPYVFIDLPLTITILQDLSALKYIPANDKTFTHLCKRFCVPETDKDIRFKSSINALIKGKATLPNIYELMKSKCTQLPHLSLPEKELLTKCIQQKFP